VSSTPAGAVEAPGRQAPASPVLAAAVRVLDRVVKLAIIVALAMVLIFTVGQVADRYLLKSSFDAHDQFARIGLVWLTFLGIAVGIRNRTNVRIELLSHFASRLTRRNVAVVLDLVILVVSAFLVIVGARLMEIGAFQAIMGTPLNYDTMYGALLVGMALLALFMVVRFADLLSGRRLEVDPPVQDDDHRD
jgi:TRAP-type C4-dicarboxylate transport system permease small subunit